MSAPARPGGAITAVYELWGDPAGAASRAEALAVEQSHEFPSHLAPSHARRSLGHVLDLSQTGPETVLARVAYPESLAGGELPQLLVLLFGNCSLLPGVRLVDVELPPALARAVGGPRLGVAGLRELGDAPHGPLLATALKPVGLSAAELAEQAYQLALGGLDLIKEDQGLANQRWAPYAERVARCGEAVARANDETGGRAVYFPALNAPVSQLAERVDLAVAAGAGGFLVTPGIGGLDQLRHLAATLPAGLALLAHPALLGSFVTSPTSGIAHGTLFGTLLRLAGADAVIFPSFGGRFSFTPAQCREIAEQCSADLAGLRPALPAPGGGMSVQRAPELVEFYGEDVVLLIGGSLHEGGDLRRSAEAFREAARRATRG